MSKYLLLSFFVFIFFDVNAQSLPIDFESDITINNFENFDGGTAEIVSNPLVNSINPSATVAKIIRNGGTIWSGSKIALSNPLDFTSNSAISMKVFTSAPIGTVVKFKLEGNGETERDVTTTVSNEWETLTWDFTGAPTEFTDLVFMFDFGNVGDGTNTSTFYFDDINQFSNGIQIDLPIDFEDPNVNYTLFDFGGSYASLDIDPMDEYNHVVKVIKTEEAAAWAGTTISTLAGLANYIPLQLDDSKMYVRVWTPAVGIPVRLKVEDANDPTHTCETESLTTVANDWEVMEFDFNNQAPGTELLSVGLNMGWMYNKASIFFNFGTEGSVTGEQTYYFDDVNFNEFILNDASILDSKSINIFPNPSNENWTISFENEIIRMIQIYDINGKLILNQKFHSELIHINSNSFNSGNYLIKIFTETGEHTIILQKIE